MHTVRFYETDTATVIGFSGTFGPTELESAVAEVQEIVPEEAVLSGVFRNPWHKVFGPVESTHDKLPKNTMSLHHVEIVPPLSPDQRCHVAKHLAELLSNNHGLTDVYVADVLREPAFDPIHEITQYTREEKIISL